MRISKTLQSKGRIAAVVAAFAVVGVAAGCGSDSSSSTTPAKVDTAAPAETTAAVADVKGKKVTLVSCFDQNPYCKVYNHAMIDGLKAAGVEVTYLEDGFDPVAQVQNIKQAIASKPDALLITASDDNSIVPVVTQAKAAGIPVFNLNGRAVDATIPNLESSILVNQAQLGTAAAENLIEGLKKEGKTGGNLIAITGTAGTNTAKDRMAAFNAVLAKNPTFKLVATEDGNWDQVKTAKIAQQLFAKYANQGGIQGAYGMADYMALGIFQAAEQANLPVGGASKGLVVTGSNCAKVGIDNLKSGKQYGTATQAPGDEGRFVVPIVLDFLAGKPIEKTNINNEDRITAENVAKFAEVCSQS